MITSQTREASLIKRVVVVSFLVVVSVIGATAYNVLGGPELIQTRSYSMSQLSADARTVAAAPRDRDPSPCAGSGRSRARCRRSASGTQAGG